MFHDCLREIRYLSIIVGEGDGFVKEVLECNTWEEVAEQAFYWSSLGFMS
jgi:hypothetical protein